MSSWTYNTRSAEQRCPAEWNAGRHDVVDDLFEQRGGIDDHGVLATRLSDQRHDGPVLGGKRALDGLGGRGGAGEGDPADALVGNYLCADRRVAGRETDGIGRDSGLPHQPNDVPGDGGRLRCGLGDDRVAGGQRGDHLAGEDREREVPRRYACEYAAAAQRQAVVFARGSGQHGGRAEQSLAFAAVVTAEVGRLANLGHGVPQGLPGFAGEQVDKPRPVCLDQVRKPVEAEASVGGRPCFPGGERRFRPADGCGHVAFTSVVEFVGAAMRARQQGPDRGGVAEIQAGGVPTLRAEKVAWQRDPRMRHRVVARDDRHGVAHQFVHGDLVVQEAVDEG